MNGIKRTYYITTEIEDRLREMAFHQKTTMSEIVRRALESYSRGQYENGKSNNTPRR